MRTGARWPIVMPLLSWRSKPRADPGTARGNMSCRPLYQSNFQHIVHMHIPNPRIGDTPPAALTLQRCHSVQAQQQVCARSAASSAAAQASHPLSAAPAMPQNSVNSVATPLGSALPLPAQQPHQHRQMCPQALPSASRWSSSHPRTSESDCRLLSSKEI